MTLTMHPKPFANTLSAWHLENPDGSQDTILQPLPAGARLTPEEATKLAKYLAPHLIDPADVPEVQDDTVVTPAGYDPVTALNS